MNIWYNLMGAITSRLKYKDGFILLRFIKWYGGEAAARARH